jgi:hypothetical protein
MLTYEALVSITFRWLDFFILVAGAGYIFWRWGIPFLNKEREDEHVAWQEVEHKIAQRAAQVDLLEQSMQQDRKLISNLEQKIRMWKAIIEQEKAAAHEQTRRAADHVIKEHAYKMPQMKHMMLYKMAVPQALEQAERALKEKFRSKEISSEFVKSVIKRLQES